MRIMLVHESLNIEIEITGIKNLIKNKCAKKKKNLSEEKDLVTSQGPLWSGFTTLSQIRGLILFTIPRELLAVIS